MLLYSVLSLTLIRILPVFLSLAGTGMSARTKLFTGGAPGKETLAVTTACMVPLSVIAHVASANPLIARLRLGGRR